MKSKKIIVTAILTLMLTLSSVMMFGCDKKVDSGETFKLLNTTITSFKTDTDTPFENGSIYDFSSNFIISNMQSMNEFGVYEEGDNHDIAILAGGLNFIENYHGYLKDSKVKTKFKDFNNAIKSMNKSYKTVKTENAKLVNFKSTSTGVNYVIYNGFYSVYRRAVEDLINKTYSVANKLGSYLSSQMKLDANIGKEDMKEENMNFYLDYQNLHVFEDYKKFLIDSCEGADTFAVAENIKSGFYTFCSEIVAKDYNATAESIKPVKSVFDALEGSRKDVRAALKNFSYYKFVNSYGGDLNAYQKSNSFAKVNYECIINYYNGSTSTLQRLANLLKDKVVK